MYNDVVYFVKDTKENEELRYSLRSVEKNFPHNKVWFFGGCPDGLKPDVYIPVKQNMPTKYLNVRGSIREALYNKKLTENFYLFNDDFFIMSSVATVIPAVDGTLGYKIQKLEEKYPNDFKIAYRRRLFNTLVALKDMKLDRMNYELHIPMLINKQKGIDILEKFENNTAFRSAYGNYYNVAKIIHPDVKVMTVDQDYDPDLYNVYLSTSDVTWARGRVGDYIRSKFTEPSRFEIDSREKQ